MAGIALGADAASHGVAPAARLVSIRVFSKYSGSVCGSAPSPCALALTSDLLLALDHVESLAATRPIDAVNLSLGTGSWRYASTCDAANASLRLGVESLRAAGVATFAAAGNDGYTNGINAPACLSAAVAVGASNDTDAVWSKSNSAPILSLLAPGVGIRSSVPPALEGTYFRSRTGTSMATPHATAAFVALRQAKPSASVSALVSALRANGRPVRDPKSGVKTPRIQLDATLLDLLPACANGMDDDGDGAVDWAGGPSGQPPDPGCGGDRNGVREGSGHCGLGGEVALLLAPLVALRRRGRWAGSRGARESWSARAR